MKLHVTPYKALHASSSAACTPQALLNPPVCQATSVKSLLHVISGLCAPAWLAQTALLQINGPAADCRPGLVLCCPWATVQLSSTIQSTALPLSYTSARPTLSRLTHLYHCTSALLEQQELRWVSSLLAGALYQLLVCKSACIKRVSLSCKALITAPIMLVGTTLCSHHSACNAMLYCSSGDCYGYHFCISLIC